LVVGATRFGSAELTLTDLETGCREGLPIER